MNNKPYIMLAMVIISGCTPSLFAMHQSVKAQIESLRAASVAARALHQRWCVECISDGTCAQEWQMGPRLTKQVNELILNSGNLVTEKEKLNHIWGDDYFLQRKEIIKKMISAGEHPNNIIYQSSETPLGEAITRKDKEFIQFLEQHGAS
jgi:hypothetical protein